MDLTMFSEDIIRKISSYLYFKNLLKERSDIHEDIVNYKDTIYKDLKFKFNMTDIRRRIIRWICFELPYETSKEILKDMEFQVQDKTVQKKQIEIILQRLDIIQLHEMRRVCKLYVY